MSPSLSLEDVGGQMERRPSGTESGSRKDHWGGDTPARMTGTPRVRFVTALEGQGQDSQGQSHVQGRRCFPYVEPDGGDPGDTNPLCSQTDSLWGFRDETSCGLCRRRERSAVQSLPSRCSLQDPPLHSREPLRNCLTSFLAQDSSLGWGQRCLPSTQACSHHFLGPGSG